MGHKQATSVSPPWSIFEFAGGTMPEEEVEENPSTASMGSG